MGKGIVLVGVVLAAAGGGGAYVYMADSGFARGARASIAKWGLGGTTAAESAKVDRESRFNKAKHKKPKLLKGDEAAKPERDTSADVGVKPANPTAEPAVEPPKEGEGWGSLDSSAAKAAKQREADSTLTTALEAAQKAYRSLKLDAAIALREAMTSAASTELQAQAEALLAKMDLADRLTIGIERNELANHKGVIEVTLVSNKTREGRLIKETSRAITLEGDFGVKETHQRDQIKTVRKLTPSERRARLEAEVTERRAQKKAPTGLDVFKLAEWCVENGLPSKAVELIEEASSLDSALVATVREDRAARLFRHWMWLRQRKDKRASSYAERIVKQFGDTRFAGEIDKVEVEAKEAREEMRRAVVERSPDPAPAAGSEGEDPEPTAEPAPRATSSAAGKLEVEGDKALEKATAFADAAQPGNPNADKNTKRAIEWYKKARSLYDQAFEQAGGADRTRLESKLEEAGMGLYWAKKMSRL